MPPPPSLIFVFEVLHTCKQAVLSCSAHKQHSGRVNDMLHVCPQYCEL